MRKAVLVNKLEEKILEVFIILLITIGVILALPDKLSSWFIAFPLAGLLYLLAYVHGKLLLIFFKKIGLSGAMLTIYAILLGFVYISFLVFFLAILGIAHSNILFYIITGLTLLLGSAKLKKDSRAVESPRKKEIADEGKTKHLNNVIIVLLVFVFLSLLFLAMIPESYHDSLLYHLAVPEQVLVTGKLVPMKHNFTTYLPLAGEMLYVPLFANDYACRLFQLSLALLLLSLLYFSLKERKLWMFLLPAGAFSFLEFTFVSFTTLVEMNVALFTVAGWLILRDRGGKNRNALIIAGILFGFALAIKYSAFVILAGAGAGYIVNNLINGRQIKEALKTVIILGSIAMLIYLPWGTRLLVTMGNPFYPAFYSVFGATNADRADVKIIFDVWSHNSIEVDSVGKLFTYPVREIPRKGGPGVLVLLLLLSIVFTKNRRRFTGEFLIILFFYLFWFLMAPTPRYLIPAVPFILLIVVSVAGEKKPGRNWYTVLIVPIVLLSIWNAIFVFQGIFYFLNPPGFYAGFDRIAYRARILTSPSGAIEYLNRNTDPASGVKALFIGESRGYGLKREYHASSPYEKQMITEYMEKVQSGSELNRLLLKDGYSHLLVNFGEWARVYEVLKIRFMNITPPGTQLYTVFNGLLRNSKELYRDRNCAVFELQSSGY